MRGNGPDPTSSTSIPLGASSEQKMITIGEVFTPEDFVAAIKILEECDGEGAEAVKRIQTEVIEPIIDHINTVTRQGNDPGYWTYALIFAIQQGATSENIR